MSCGGAYEQFIFDAQVNFIEGDYTMALRKFRAAQVCEESKKDRVKLNRYIQETLNEIRNISPTQSPGNVINKFESFRRSRRTLWPPQPNPRSKQFIFLNDDYNFHFIAFNKSARTPTLSTLKLPIGMKKAWLIYHKRSRTTAGDYYLAIPYPTKTAASTAKKDYIRLNPTVFPNNSDTYVLNGLSDYLNRK